MIEDGDGPSSLTSKARQKEKGTSSKNKNKNAVAKWYVFQLVFLHQGLSEHSAGAAYVSQNICEVDYD